MPNKSLLLFFVLSFLFHGCSNVAEQKTSEASTTVASKPIELSKDGFLDKVMNYEKNQSEWVFEGDLPCIVDFYADWCAPCRMVAPVLDELAEEYKGKIHIYKVNIDRERELAAVFGVRSIPTFLYCPLNGNPQILPSIGNNREQTKQILKKHIEEVLLNRQ